MERYIQRKDKTHVKVLDRYQIQGFISSGTYGKVYKACSKTNPHDTKEYAIKKFKAEKESDVATYSGLSQSACREMSLCREVHHDSIVQLQEIILEDKCIYMVFAFYEYDLLQIIQYHVQQVKKQKIPEGTVRSILFQLLEGIKYLHENWILHRDLKPANIMISKDGVVKIGDLGLARRCHNPIQPLYNGDKVVVTIWYRAPELLLGSKHYGPAIDMWAIGCIFAELLILRPLFKGDEVKTDTKKTTPFQRLQMTKIMELLGTPNVQNWPGVADMPEYNQLSTIRSQHFTNQLPTWYRAMGSMASTAQGLKLIMSLVEWDPAARLSATSALLHPYFAETPKPARNVFEGSPFLYPNRQIKVEDADMNKSASSVSNKINNTHSQPNSVPPGTQTSSSAAMLGHTANGNGNINGSIINIPSKLGPRGTDKLGGTKALQSMNGMPKRPLEQTAFQGANKRLR